MYLISGADDSFAEDIFTAIDKVFAKNQILWKNCGSLSVDNTNAIIGKSNSIGSRFLERNKNLFMQVALATLYT